MSPGFIIFDVLTEEEIIKGFNEGSEKSFRWLYDQYFTLLRYYGLQYIDDSQEIDDIIQDLFISIWEKKTSFKSLSSIRSYMFVSVKNRCLNSLRKDITKSTYIKSQEEESEESALEKLIKLDVFDQIMTSFRKLPPAMQKVYWLSINGYSHKEITEKLNISINTIKTHKKRANHFLKEDLKDLFTVLISII